jgi:hypothetical protein
LSESETFTVGVPVRLMQPVEPPLESQVERAVTRGLGSATQRALQSLSLDDLITQAADDGEWVDPAEGIA